MKVEMMEQIEAMVLCNMAEYLSEYDVCDIVQIGDDLEALQYAQALLNELVGDMKVGTYKLDVELGDGFLSAIIILNLYSVFQVIPYFNDTSKLELIDSQLTYEQASHLAVTFREEGDGIASPLIVPE